MSILEDKTLKPNRSKLWLYAPIITLMVFIILFANVITIPRSFIYIALVLIFALILFILIRKIAGYYSSQNKEVREYEEEMRKRGRR